MKICMYAAVFVFGLCPMFPVSAAASRRCKHDEVAMETSSQDLVEKYTCKKCISCPAGYGPSHHCGGQYPNGTVITCVPCIDGVTYSKEHSISSCQPCNQCGGKETLRKCTPTRDTSCSSKCRVGFVMDNVLELCLRDSSFKTTPRHIDKLKTTALLPETTTIPRMNTTSTTQAQDKETERETHGMHTTNQTHLDTSGKKRQPAIASSNSSDYSKDNKMFILLVICIVLIMMVAIGVVGYLINNIYFRSDNVRPNGEEQIELANRDSTSQRSSQDIGPWPDNLRLQDIKLSLRSDIAILISGNSTVVKGWRAIGGEMGLSSTELQAIDVAGQKRDTLQGEELFTKLISEQPELTLNKFVEILEVLGRRDVVDQIKNKYNNENEVNTVVQITQNLHDNHMHDV